MTDVERFGRAAGLRGRWWLSALSAVSFFGDESGSHRDPDGTFVLSGYLGRDDTWNSFSDDWESVLQQSPPIKFFHMRECIKLEGEFEFFNDYQAKRKLNSLVDVLRPRLKAKKLVEFTAFLRWDVYERAVSGVLKDRYDNPYFFLLHAIVGATNTFLTESPAWAADAPVEYFFDEQSAKLEYGVSRQFQHVKAIVHNTAFMSGIAFRDDQLSYPLQAADLIAWTRRRRELHLPEDVGERPEYRKLHAATKEGRFMRVKEDGLRDLSTEVTEAIASGKTEL
jgi:hypothetical protein